MSKAVAQARRVSLRDPRWWAFEQAYLRAHPDCAACVPGQQRGGVQLHHIVAWQHFHGLGRPDLEFDERNLIVLCETIHRSDPANQHHLMLGHLGCFTRVNLAVRADAELFRGMRPNELKADPRWLAKKLAQIPPFGRMTKVEKAQFRQVIDQMFPL